MRISWIQFATPKASQPLRKNAMMSAPMSDPKADPSPPLKLPPPITTAAITSSSVPMAVVGSPTVSRQYCITPAKPPQPPGVFHLNEGGLHPIAVAHRRALHAPELLCINRCRGFLAFRYWPNNPFGDGGGIPLDFRQCGITKTAAGHGQKVSVHQADGGKDILFRNFLGFRRLR